MPLIMTFRNLKISKIWREKGGESRISRPGIGSSIPRNMMLSWNKIQGSKLWIRTTTKNWRTPTTSLSNHWARKLDLKPLERGCPTPTWLAIIRIKMDHWSQVAKSKIHLLMDKRGHQLLTQICPNLLIPTPWLLKVLELVSFLRRKKQKSYLRRDFRQMLKNQSLKQNHRLRQRKKVKENQRKARQLERKRRKRKKWSCTWRIWKTLITAGSFLVMRGTTKEFVLVKDLNISGRKTKSHRNWIKIWWTWAWKAVNTTFPDKFQALPVSRTLQMHNLFWAKSAKSVSKN